MSKRIFLDINGLADLAFSRSERFTGIQIDVLRSRAKAAREGAPIPARKLLMSDDYETNDSRDLADCVETELDQWLDDCEMIDVRLKGIILKLREIHDAYARDGVKLYGDPISHEKTYSTARDAHEARLWVGRLERLLIDFPESN